MISLLSFVRTGRLGTIGLGATRSEVETVFAPANYWLTGFEMPQSPIWKYGNVEICFDAEGKVILIFCDDFYVTAEAPFVFDTGGLEEKTEEEVEAWLHHNTIQFNKEPYPWIDGATIIRAISQVELMLYADDALSVKESNSAPRCHFTHSPLNCAPQTRP